MIRLFNVNRIPHLLQLLLYKMSKGFLYVILCLVSPTLHASCPEATPWSVPVALSNSSIASAYIVTSSVFSAATSVGFMVVWANLGTNAYYSFSSDGVTWQSGQIGPATYDVPVLSDIFVAGNATGFIVTWIDSSNNGWSSFSANNGETWSEAMQINPDTLSLNANSDVYVSGGSSGFVATMIGADDNLYVSFSTGTAAWSSPTQVTTDGSVFSQNENSQTGRGFVSVVVVGNSCMLTWISQTLATFSAYFDSINPFSSTTIYPVVSVGFFESIPIVTAMNGYFMVAARANVNVGMTSFSVATTPSNWATFSLFSSTPANPNAGPWIAANHAGFMSTWIVGDNVIYYGSPMWTLSDNDGFNWTPLCPILPTPSITIEGPIGLSANSQGFVATWLDSSDSNAYASFYATPASNTTSNDLFVTLLEQKYGPLL